MLNRYIWSRSSAFKLLVSKMKPRRRRATAVSSVACENRYSESPPGKISSYALRIRHSLTEKCASLVV
jgi:hypothetical protein